MPNIAFGIIVIAVILIAALSRLTEKNRRYRGRRGGFEKLPEYKRAGIRGELIAERLIRSVMRDNDRLFRSVTVDFEGKSTELDNVVVNNYGVFIIEVKNYKGLIVGSEKDSDWRQYKTTPAGNTYEKSARNPIKQVNRQIFILSRYFKQYEIDVWIRGYSILLGDNSPVDSELILRNSADVDRAIHTPDRIMLDAGTIEEISRLLGSEPIWAIG